MSPPRILRPPTILSGAILLALAASSPAAGVLPLQPGMAVVTCEPTSPPWVLAVIDLRDPECDPTAVLGEPWPTQGTHNEMPNATGSALDEWTLENLGGAFGIALDDLDPPNIHVTSADVYQAEAPGDGRIRTIDGTTGAISVLAELPNSGVGLGNLAFDARHRQLLVTNFEDGRIYRVALDGTILGSFDPFEPDDGEPGWAPLGERLWGIAVWSERVYFGRWNEDRVWRDGPANEVHSVALDPDGALGTVTRREIVLEPELDLFPEPYTSPVSDLAVDARGALLVAERPMHGTTFRFGEAGRVHEYRWSDGTWQIAPVTFGIGDEGRLEAAGGVDVFPCTGDSTCVDAEPRVVVTGHGLIVRSDDAVPSGLQIMPRDGGDRFDSYLIDAETEDNFKPGMGDVELYRHPLRAAPRPAMSTASAADLLDCGPGVRVAWEAATFTGTTGTGTYSLHRSSVSCEDAALSPPLVTGLTDLEWIDTTATPDVPYFYLVEALDGDAPPCVDREASVARACIAEPVVDSATLDRPAGVGATLFASHDGQEITLTWTDARPLLSDEHFHLLKAWDSPTTSFTLANGEGDLSRSFTETDTSSPRQFFDLRVANACEELSPDDFPPGWDVPRP